MRGARRITAYTYLVNCEGGPFGGGGGSTDLACHLIFEVERDYWQARNRAAQVQKARQDRLGLGWANHDHHTFRCSRRFFPSVIGIFERLGFQLRERFHAGAQAGSTSQRRTALPSV